MRVRLIGAGAVAVTTGLTTGCGEQTPAGTESGTYIVVSPADLHGWQLVTNKKREFPYKQNKDPASTASYRFRNGPGRPPAGTGSLQMQTGNEPNSLVAALAPALAGLRLRSVTSVSYSTYVTKVGSRGSPLADVGTARRSVVGHRRAFTRPLLAAVDVLMESPEETDGLEGHR
jgi:hypothetical protein